MNVRAFKHGPQACLRPDTHTHKQTTQTWQQINSFKLGNVYTHTHVETRGQRTNLFENTSQDTYTRIRTHTHTHTHLKTRGQHTNLLGNTSQGTCISVGLGVKKGYAVLGMLMNASE
jgi:hypothetical protein